MTEREFSPLNNSLPAEHNMAMHTLHKGKFTKLGSQLWQ